jgi:helix-hairpin-helix protein/UvrD-like helicase family protein
VTSQDKAAELLAAVKAVESGERSAASFFTAPEPPRRTRPAPAAPVRSGLTDGGGAAAEPAAVTDELRAVLAEGGAPEALAPAVAELFGGQAGQVLRGDPWQLLGVPGVRPEQADSFARAVLGDEAAPGDERRILALVGLLLEDAARRGHTALEPAALAKALASHAVPDPDEAVRTAIDGGAVLVFEDALDVLDAAPAAATGGGGENGEETEETEETERPVRVLLGLDRYALAEESLADGLARLTATFTGGEGQPETADWERAAAAAPSPSAGELIGAAAGHGLVAHTGGETARAEPAALLAAARALGLRAWAATHGAVERERVAGLVRQAAQAYTELTAPRADAREVAAAEAEPQSDAEPEPVVTVAGLLAGAEGPGRDEEGALALDMLVVLDAPQLDAETGAALVEAVPDGARLVLSGDPAVLGSAGAGAVFTDLLAARACPQVVSRTPDLGPLGELVSGVGVGELPQVTAPGKEVVIVPVRDAAEAVHRAVQLVADSVPRALGVPSEQTQVVTTGHGGGAGTGALNTALKERLNPGPGRFGGFDPGDRVAHSPAPGHTRVGTVVSADDRGLHLECAGEQVLVPPARVAETVRHGWAVTAHQAAGTTWPAAVVVIPGDAAGVLTRDWVYTAFGRARRHLSVVQGAGGALPAAVADTPARERTTRLRTLLTRLPQRS